MTWGVYRRGKDLVHLSETEEAAILVASRFSDNRQFNDDYYEVKPVDIFKLTTHSVVPEFIHQVIKFPQEHLYYKFEENSFVERGTWLQRLYLTAEEADRRNRAFPPFYFVRATTEEDAVNAFEGVLKTLRRTRN